MRSLHSTSGVANPPNLRFCHSSHSLSPKSLFLLLLPRTQFPSHQNLSSQTNARKSSSSFSSGSVIRASMAASSPATGTETGTERFSVLFVCLGNICRSPAAEGVFRDLVKKRGLDSKFQIDSAGTINYHEGNQADPRMRAASKNRGIQITSISRPIRPSDFRDFDLILAMDKQNKDDILDAFNRWKFREPLPDEAHKKVYSRNLQGWHDETEVPDPYYGGPQGFDQHALEETEEYFMFREIHKETMMLYWHPHVKRLLVPKQVLDLLEDACESLLDTIVAENKHVFDS